ncbi:MAG: glycine cleavage system aminomethyltransferase GcvT [Planctomycetes bacterium]|nr:glycine cleavage system aminomethyltransferase GcvT [Planctomycetota bacterium]
MNTTPLFEKHKSLGANLAEFGGFNMPLWYSSIGAEHTAVRARAGIFDVSHMGRLIVSADTIEKATEALNRVVTNDVSKIKPGKARYSLIANKTGGCVDDIIIYRRENDYLVVCNAGNRPKVVPWMHENLSGATMTDISEEIAMIAYQGRQSLLSVEKLASADVAPLGYYAFLTAEVAGVPDVMVARTGYTGEDGFELYAPAGKICGLWDALLEEGKSIDAVPCGLGARDTLRLEAGMPLYGHEIEENISPLAAGLGFGIRFDKGDYIGRDWLEKEKNEGTKTKLVGIEAHGKRIPRTHGKLFVSESDAEDAAVGEVTSGTASITLGKNIAMAYVPAELSEVGTKLFVQISKGRYPATVVGLPFYKREK